jgi:hypothetical protein
VISLLGAFFFVVGLAALVWYVQRPTEAQRQPDPVVERYERTGIALAGEHPPGCAEPCCWEIRLTEMHDDFDWEAREHEMRSKR